ncbi:MAG: exosortase [Phycisphaerae bacterium]
MIRTHIAEPTGCIAPSVPEPVSGDGVAADLVILAGTVGPESPWASGVPRPLLPLPGTTIIEALLRNLSDVHSGTCTICTNGSTELIASHVRVDAWFSSRVEFCRDPIPRGTAGCIKACESRIHGDAILVASASVWLEDDPLWMLEQHRATGNALTVFCTRGVAGTGLSQNGQLKPAGIYCCDPAALGFVPETGYQDIKEQLLPALQNAGLSVGAVTLRHQTREVVDWSTYLHAVERALSHGRFHEDGFRELAPNVWCGQGVEIEPRARIVGPAFLGHRSRIDNDAVVIGPAILGDGSHVGPGSRLLRVVAPRATRFPAGAAVVDRLVSPVVPEPVKREAAEPNENGKRQITNSENRANDLQPAIRHSAFAISSALVALFVWAFWYTIADLWYVWQHRGDYSAGQLVPLAAVYMIAVRRRALNGLRLTFGLPGIGVFAVGLVSNLLGNYYLYSSLENLGLVLCANGLAMILLGWRGYKRVWYPLMFLLLMIPLPGRVHDAVMLPLQGFSACVSTGILEILGIPTQRYGHILEVGGHQVAVAEACNGLRMALAFLIVAGIVAYLVPRPRWQKLTVVLSSLPIALTCNITRIVVTACLFGAGYGWLAQGTLHEVAGLLMMPVALCLILLELWLLHTLHEQGAVS